MGCNCNKKFTLKSAARDAMKRDFVDSKIKTMRIESCKACSNLLAGITCIRCGCFVHAKIRFRRAECPEGRW